MNQKERFDLVLLLGETMLQNGGEIFRINETMQFAARQFGLEEFSAYVIANGIFATTVVEGKLYSSQIRDVSLAPIMLCRIDAVNTLSREIVSGQLTPEQALEKLHRIRKLSPYRNLVQILASGVGSGSFCFLFGGGLMDCLLAFCAGSLLYVFLLYGAARAKLPKIISNILGAGLATLFCCVVFRLGWGNKLDKMVIGAIFPLVPGVPLTNAVRNFLENDFLSGMIRLVDALLTAGCIAIGVGSIINIWSGLVGGIVL